MIGQYTAVYRKRGNRIIAYIEELAGVNSEGRTLAEARRNLKLALAPVLGTNRNLSISAPSAIPDPNSLAF